MGDLVEFALEWIELSTALFLTCACADGLGSVHAVFLPELAWNPSQTR